MQKKTSLPYAMDDALVQFTQRVARIEHFCEKGSEVGYENKSLKIQNKNDCS